MQTVRVSVRTLVEFLLRSGDLAEGRGGWADKEAMLAGARIHRKIQKSRGPLYQAEVSLYAETAFPEFTLRVEGRADGITEEDGQTVIEEIKGIYADPASLEEAVPVHLAQAKCYAYMRAQNEDLAEVGICMTYVHMETEEVRQFRSVYSRAELEDFFDALMKAYEPWAVWRIRHTDERTASLQALPFPFPYRPGQKKLAMDVYRTILREKQVFVQAPTGVGKTMSVLYPALKSMGEGLTDILFYLTAKTTTRTAAEEAAQILREKGLSCKALTMTAKEKICPQALEGNGMQCHPDACVFAKGHFDRINDVLYKEITGADAWDREEIQRSAREGRVCPYALQTDLADFADLVIGDYNYAFDPTARLRRFFGEEKTGQPIVFLIDEAHNLVERGREMFSADLYREEFLSLRRRTEKDAQKQYRKLGASLKKCAGILLDFRKESEELRIFTDLSDFLILLMRVAGLLEEALEECPQGELRDEMLAFYFRTRAFLSAAENADARYLRYGRPVGKNDYLIRIFCTDPSLDLQTVLDTGRSAVLFSATFIPIRYYKALLSGRDDDYAIEIPSPFPEENRCILIGCGVTTRYTERTRENYRKIASCIVDAVSARAGHYMVYCPSYQVMEEVCAEAELLWKADASGPEILMQEREMGEAERETFLERFAGPDDRTLVGFCVMGGIFAEGIDLTGDRLIGVVVVGTGLPQIGEERELLRGAYGSRGFDYAYRYPGMNKVLQAAGRVIRTETDTGWILLLDERFEEPAMRPCFPPSWHDRKSCSPQEIGPLIEAFWADKKIDKDKPSGLSSSEED